MRAAVQRERRGGPGGAPCGCLDEDVESNPIVVASAIKLTEPMRARLSEVLGEGFVVLDIRKAPSTANVVIAPRVSDMGLWGLRREFPDARILVSEIFDPAWGLDHRGPIHEALGADVDGYLLANSLEALGGEVANQANLQLTGSRSRTPLQLPGAEATDPPEPSPREEAEASRPRTIWWINGPFGVGKTTLVERLLERDPSLWSFDPERVGDFLRGVIHERVRDYQSWRAWRALTAETVIQLMELHDGDLVCPMSLLHEAWTREILVGVSLADLRQRHLVLHADRPELERRIRADIVETDAARWRLASVERYEAARSWLDPIAEVLDTTALSPDEVADRVSTHMRADRERGAR